MRSVEHSLCRKVFSFPLWASVFSGDAAIYMEVDQLKNQAPDAPRESQRIHTLYINGVELRYISMILYHTLCISLDPCAMSESPTRTIDGPSGHAIEYGLQEPDSPVGHIVFVMGLGNHRTMWRYQFQHFACTHSLLSIDNRGIGRSSDPPGMWTVADMAADVIHVLQTVASHWKMPIHLVGHSMGGLVCYEVVHQLPQGEIDSLSMLNVGLRRSLCDFPVRLPSACALLGMLCASPMDMVNQSLEINYPEKWLSQKAFDGACTPPTNAMRMGVRPIEPIIED